MNGIESERSVNVEGQGREKRRSTRVAVACALMLAIASLVVIAARMNHQSIDPQYFGTWKLTMVDGTTWLVIFNSDGTVTANDNCLYRWTSTSNEIHIDVCEQTRPSPWSPKSVFRYLFPDRGHVILTPRRSGVDDEVVLIGSAVELRR